MKYHVLLVCSAGLSTSILVRSLEKKLDPEQISFSCCDSNSASHRIIENDFVILAPHIKFMEGKLREVCQQFDIPLSVLSSKDYMNGNGDMIIELCKNVLDFDRKPKAHRILFLYNHTGYLTHTLLKNRALLDWAKNASYEIEALSLDAYSYNKDIACLIIEDQLKYHSLEFIHRRQPKIEIPIRFCTSQTYLDPSGQSMITQIKSLINLKEKT